ncbi:hypothetical protein IW492_07745 [Enterococcus sp. BWB1-3]|uniref:hypothetical protein n=1 Tax=unclassified Enterococcus TaxID=2608891 RepID=UPI0019211024|nr:MULTISPECIES: hypothetical protein [unclassified Enterococcus]MBL1229126.1 hypothetical protein [Enterococcus sp. BWB1-3]MCB5952506.1 hypothetical protein [Enterococcus sp. BWT-B8]
MKQLRTHLSEQAYLKKVREYQKEVDYQLYAHRSDNRETIACCGVMNRQTLMTVVYGFVIWL